MFETILPFMLEYKFIILFYLGVILFLLIRWKKIDVQARFILLYRMKWGLRWMDQLAQKFREWIVLWGYIGVGAGYVGLLLISYLLVKNLYYLITQPAAISGVSLVLPGINVPGMGVLPFWYWLLAIFVIALVHEFAHGLVARAHRLEVKNTGLVFFGPILGAFVEPNEEKLRKEKDIKQYSVLAAGSFANVLLAIVALLLLNFLFIPLQESLVEPTGFTFDAYFGEEYPFAQAGLAPGTLITGINKEKITNFQQFSEELSFHRPKEKIAIATPERSYEITLAQNPDNPKKGFLGIKNIHNEFEIKERFQKGLPKIIYWGVNWLSGFLKWLFLLSLGIGLFNLLPLPLVDGGRMVQVTLHRLKGREKGEKRYHQLSWFFLLILLLNLLYPWLSRVLF